MLSWDFQKIVKLKSSSWFVKFVQDLRDTPPLLCPPLLRSLPFAYLQNNKRMISVNKASIQLPPSPLFTYFDLYLETMLSKRVSIASRNSGLASPGSHFGWCWRPASAQNILWPRTEMLTIDFEWKWVGFIRVHLVVYWIEFIENICINWV
jgi:hypothetical protein